jgi:hypothetical protein
MKTHQPLSVETKKDTIYFLRELCKKNKVKVSFRKVDGDFYGECETTGKKININKNSSKKQMVMTVFHELGHVHCIRNRIWSDFHNKSKYSYKKAFLAENWIEWWAKNNWDKSGMRKYFGQYKFFYSKKDKKQILEWIKKNY